MEKSEVLVSSMANGAAKVSNQLHIPADLTFSILSKLPLKSLRRFGCIHKSWALLCESPNFMSLYCKNLFSSDHSSYDGTPILLNQTIGQGCEFCNFDEKYEFHSLSGKRFENSVKLDLPDLFPGDSHGFNICGSCCVNGILCLVYKYEEIIVLWNLTTKEFNVIPPSPLVLAPHWEVVVDAHRFGYDPTRDDYKVIRHIKFSPEFNCDIDGMSWEEDVAGNRFGYEFLRDDYKVIRRVQFISRNNCNLHRLSCGCVLDKEFISYDSLWEIYCLKRNSWKMLDIDMPFSCDEQEVYMDGMCHWFGSSEAHNETSLVSFDLGTEVFFTTLVPSNMVFNFNLKHLVVLNGCIALILKHTESTTFHILVLGELGVKESWTKIFIVGPLPWIEYPIGTGEKGDIFFRKKDGGIVWFNLSTQVIEELQMMEGLGVITSKTCIKITAYKENLLPLGGISNNFFTYFHP